MQILKEPTVVHEVTLELRLRPQPRWALAALAALYLGLPRLAATGETWGRTNQEGGNNYHPIPSGVVTSLTVTGGVAQAPTSLSGAVGWPPSVVLGRTGVGRAAPQSSILMTPCIQEPWVAMPPPPGCSVTTTGNFVGIGTSSPQFMLDVKGHVRGAQCLWIGSSPRCAGDWQ